MTEEDIARAVAFQLGQVVRFENPVEGVTAMEVWLKGDLVVQRMYYRSGGSNEFVDRIDEIRELWWAVPILGLLPPALQGRTDSD